LLDLRRPSLPFLSYKEKGRRLGPPYPAEETGRLPYTVNSAGRDKSCDGIGNRVIGSSDVSGQLGPGERSGAVDLSTVENLHSTIAMSATDYYEQLLLDLVEFRNRHRNLLSCRRLIRV
jgi:hypothetical protein